VIENDWCPCGASPGQTSDLCNRTKALQHDPQKHLTQDGSETNRMWPSGSTGTFERIGAHGSASIDLVVEPPFTEDEVGDVEAAGVPNTLRAYLIADSRLLIVPILAPWRARSRR
jgi:hypothetical protein